MVFISWFLSHKYEHEEFLLKICSFCFILVEWQKAAVNSFTKIYTFFIFISYYLFNLVGPNRLIPIKFDLSKNDGIKPTSTPKQTITLHEIVLLSSVSVSFSTNGSMRLDAIDCSTVPCMWYSVNLALFYVVYLASKQPCGKVFFVIYKKCHDFLIFLVNLNPDWSESK